MIAVNDVCQLCDLDREICSCIPAPRAAPRRHLFRTCPVHYWRDQFDPRDFKEERRVS